MSLPADHGQPIQKIAYSICKACVARSNLPIMGDKYLTAICDHCKKQQQECVLIPVDLWDSK